MALYFRQRKSAKKTVQVILAFAALLVAMALLAIWLLIGYYQNLPPADTDDSSSPDTYVEPVAGVENCLLILNVADDPRFLLIQTDPEDNQISVASVPATLADADGYTLSTLLERNGSIRVMQTVATALDLPVDHYVTLDRSGINKFLNELDEGITIKLPEDVVYTDENGIQSTLRSGKRTLTAGQATAVLSHTGWSKAKRADTVACNMVVGAFNQYCVSTRSLRGYFGVLSNAAQTDLRIDNYTAYASALTQLAENNDGSVCTAVTLAGKTVKGHFVPDLDTIRQETGLYE